MICLFIQSLNKYYCHIIVTHSGESDNARSKAEKEHYQHKSHSKKNIIELIDSPEDYSELDAEKYKSDKCKTDRAPEDPETIKRRAKFLDADREMTKRKELAREELEARREMRREKRTSESPHTHHRRSRHKSHRQNQSPEEHSVIQLSESEDDDDKRCF